MDAIGAVTPADHQPLADRLEARGAALLFGAFGLLPMEWASGLGGAVARRIGPFLGISKRARINLRRAFPELSPSFPRPVSSASSPGCGTISAASPPNTRTCTRFECSRRTAASRPTGSSIWTGRYEFARH